MNVLFNCPGCGQEIAVDEAGVGQEITCPSCEVPLTIPDGERVPDDVVPAGGDAGGETPPAAEETAPAEAAATPAQPPAKEPEKEKEKEEPKKKLSVPVRKEEPKKKDAGKSAGKKPEPPKEDSGPRIRVKTIRRVQCMEMGHDMFDEMVGEFLGTIDPEQIVGVYATTYSHLNSEGKNLGDYGVMIIYKG